MPFRVLAGEEGPFGDLLRAAERGRTPYLVLTVLCLLLFLPGLATLAPTDRDEARFMQASKQMIESGDYVHIKVQDAPRTKKPIGIHWLQVASVKAFGQPLNTAWPYRIPSVLMALLAVLLTCALGRHLFGERAGFVAGLMVATLPLTLVEAHLAKTDAALLGFTTLAMLALARVYLAIAEKNTVDKRWAAAFWLAVGAAILIKGPAVLVVVGAAGATLCAADRSLALLRALKPWWGVPLAFLVLLPWLLTLIEPGNGNFLLNAIREDVLPKLAGGQESHGALPGTHLALMPATAWPWSLVIPMALIAVWPARNTPAIRFCLAWLVPAWLAFEAIPTKLPHYVLPLMPAAALLLGAAVQDSRRWQGALTRPFGRTWRGMWALVSVALAVGVLWAVHMLSGNVTTLAILAAAIAGIAAVFAVTVGAVVPLAACGTLAIIGAAFSGVLVDVIAPRADKLWIAPRLAEEVARAKPTGPVVLVGFHEPSAIFLLGTKTRISDSAGAAGIAMTNPGTLAAVDAPDVEAFRQSVTAGGYTVVTGAVVAGLNYANGTPVALNFLTIKKSDE